MVSPESAMIINVVLNAIILIPAIIVSLMIPSDNKIRSGKAGHQIGATWIPGLMIFLFIVAVVMIPVTVFLLEGNNLPWGLGLDVIALMVVLMTLYIYFSAKKRFKELSHVYQTEEVEVVHAETIEAQHIDHQHHVPHQPHEQAHPQANMMTVECPQCGNHIHLPEGSHQITCPYCGLSGFL